MAPEQTPINHSSDERLTSLLDQQAADWRDNRQNSLGVVNEDILTELHHREGIGDEERVQLSATRDAATQEPIQTAKELGLKFADIVARKNNGEVIDPEIYRTAREAWEDARRRENT